MISDLVRYNSPLQAYNGALGRFKLATALPVFKDLPRDDNHKVHDVPGVSEVGVGVEDEAHGDDLGAHLHREDAHEDRLQLLQLTERQRFRKRPNSWTYIIGKKVLIVFHLAIHSHLY